MAGNELIVTRAAEDGNTVISVTTDLRAVDYPVIAWIAAGFRPDARVALLWQTDVEPARVNKRPLEIEAGQLLPADLHRDPHWLGRIVGLALVLQGPVEAPLRVRGVIAKPAGAVDTLRDRAREWLAPENIDIVWEPPPPSQPAHRNSGGYDRNASNNSYAYSE